MVVTTSPTCSLVKKKKRKNKVIHDTRPIVPMVYNYLLWATHFTAAISVTLLQGWVATKPVKMFPTSVLISCKYSSCNA